MGDDSVKIGHIEAQAMLDAFASVGATRFDVTWTTLAGDKEWFRRSVSLADLTRTLPAMLDSAPSKQRNVIVRPHGPAVTFIQLDDLKVGNLTRIAPAVFLTLETSPGDFQAWVAMPDAEDKAYLPHRQSLARHSRPPLLGKGSGLPLVEDCQQQRPTMTLRITFMITGIGVHDPPERADTVVTHGAASLA